MGRVGGERDRENIICYSIITLGRKIMMMHLSMSAVKE